MKFSVSTTYYLRMLCYTQIAMVEKSMKTFTYVKLSYVCLNAFSSEFKVNRKINVTS